MGDNADEIRRRKQRWEETTLRKGVERLKLEHSPTRFFTPLDVGDFDFLKKVGFPGEYPFTSGTYATMAWSGGEKGTGDITQVPGLVRAGRYSGYGTPEDTYVYYRQMQEMGQRGGPNLAFDLPTQCGYDSDNPTVTGEVGKVGVSIDSLKDFEIIYDAFKGESDLDKIASNFTINAPVNIIMAMYIALAQKRGIALEKLRATPQNDILKEYTARGTYIFPPKPAMRMFRDSLVFFTKYLPGVNITSFGGYHMREAGATREQDLAFSLSNGIAYLQTGIDAGLDIDSFAPRFSSAGFGGTVEFFKEIALARAARRMWAKILKEQFGAKNPRSMLLRPPMTVHLGYSTATKQRPLNNLTRSIIAGIACAVSSGPPMCFPPYDEALGLGWSLEALQLQEDADRILQHEAKLTEVIDPLAGSYYVESLTDEIEQAAWEEIAKIQKMGGAVVAIENGYMQRQIARSAYEYQKRVERREALIVGLNCFTGEHELEVLPSRLVPHPYDPRKREEAEAKQVANLTHLKKNRDNHEVTRYLNELKTAARKEDENLIPYFIDCAKAYVTIQEMCDVLRDIFGEYQPVSS